MNLQAEELEEKIAAIAQSIGKKCGNIIDINLDAFLKKWREEYPSDKIKKFFVANVLRSKFSAEDAGEQILRVQAKTIFKEKPNDEHEDSSKKKGPKNKRQVKQFEELKKELALKILGYLNDYLKNKGSDDVAIMIEEIHRLWQENNPGKSFKSYGVKSFKKFLLTDCDLRNDESSIICNENEIIRKIKLINRNPELDCDKDSMDIDKEEGNVNENNKTDQLMEMERQTETTLDSNDQSDKLESDEKSALSEKVLSCNENKKVERVLNVENKEQQAEARCRFNQLITVLYDCCLERLRQIFMDIHKPWKNTKHDIVNMEKGKFKCAFERQKRVFETGDIRRWDVSLICNVLLWTKLSKRELKSNPSYSDYEKAIRKILKVKNDFYSHINSLELTKDEFEKTGKDLKEASLSLGVNEDDFNRALKAGVDLKYAKLYMDMLKEEVDPLKAKIEQHDDRLCDVEAKMQELLDGAKQGDVRQIEIPKKADEIDPERWDEWLRVRNFLKKVDTDRHQYILIADRMTSAFIQGGSLGVLGRVRWKVVFDLDPNSDIDGLLRCCSPEESSGGMVVPVSLTGDNINININFDAKRMHWVSANGKNRASEEDVPKDNLGEWKVAFKTPIQDIVRICCENLDSRKPTFCIVLPVTPGISKSIANYIAKQIYQRFTHSKYDIKYISFDPEIDLSKIGREPRAIYSNLSLKFFLIGLHSLLGESQDSFEVPCRLKDLPVKIPIRTFQFISEYFDILYSGCENIPKELSPEEQEEFENEHLKSFLHGNPITFESLHYGHDARRSLTTKITEYITSMPQKFTSSQIVQINHAPGTGCTTIARRVLWDVREEFPCMILKELLAGDNPSDSDLESYVIKLWERVIDLEKMCDLSPIVLIDGSSRIVKLISDQLVRRLAASSKKAIILRCVDYEGNCDIDHEYFHKESTFEVKSVLKDEEQDLREFRTKYFDYCSRFNGEQNIKDLREDLAVRTRVFHFAMAAMLDYHKLVNIVLESLELLRKDFPHEYEVAILVAFIQLFASSPTPVSLLEKYFGKKHQTYNEISKGYSEYLLNLMVGEKARSKNKFIGQKGSRHQLQEDDEENLVESEEHTICTEAYSFQHYAVAKLVWDNSGRQLDTITEDFVKSPLLRDYKKNQDLQGLIDDLFLYNKVYKKDTDPEPEAEDLISKHGDNFMFALPVTEHRFSLLMSKLEEFHNSGRIFEDVAKKVNDITYFSHAARYFVYRKKKKPDFKKAGELINAGLEVGKNCPVKKIRDIRNTEGYIRLREMRNKKDFDSIDELKHHADKVHTLFHRAKDNPPRQFPNPLLGIVSIWIFCLEKIIKLKEGNVEEALSTVFQNEFFRGAIGECFELLDEVEIIVKNNPKLVDPDYTMQLCSDRKLDLMKIIGRKLVKQKRKRFYDIDVPKLCEEMSTKYFLEASNKEILRLRAIWMIRDAGNVSRVSNKEKLFEILKQLVQKYGMYEYARQLLDITVIQSNPSLDICACQDIIRQWQRKLKEDAFSYLYDYALSFVCVANSDISENRERYKRAKKTCFEKTKWSMVRNKPYYYIAKCEESGIGKLVSSYELKERYSKAVTNDKGRERSTLGDDEMANENEYAFGRAFWNHYASKLLYKCTGRIKMDMTSTKKGHGYPYIALEQGSLRINISSQTLGIPFKDYRPDSRVTFYICFTLAGPKAEKIHLVQDNDMKGDKPGFGRQGSVIRNNKR